MEYDQSDDIKELATALAKAQGELENAKKSSENPFFKSKYAELVHCWEACRETLSKHGLSVCQIPVGGTGTVGVRTMLLHSSGQYIGGELLTTPTKTDPQTLGSIITYFRRYALQAIIGLSAEDDDAIRATHGGEKKAAPELRQDPAKPDPDKPMSEAQRKKIYAMCKEKSLTDDQIREFTKLHGLHKEQAPTSKKASVFFDSFDQLYSKYIVKKEFGDEPPLPDREPGQD